MLLHGLARTETSLYEQRREASEMRSNALLHETSLHEVSGPTDSSMEPTEVTGPMAPQETTSALESAREIAARVELGLSEGRSS